MELIPNASNVIPGVVKFSIDIRDCDFQSKNIFIEKLQREINDIKKKRGVNVKLNLENHDVPMKCNETIISEIEKNCLNADIPYIHTISDAYHDSMFVGKFAPVYMIFVPSKNGISHSPEEWTDYEDIARGTDISMTLYNLANKIKL